MSFVRYNRSKNINKVINLNYRTFSAIPIPLIKKLRMETKSPINDCRKALKVSLNDFNSAQEWLRKNSCVVREKIKTHLTKNGVVQLSVSADKRSGCILQFETETDFVSKNAIFNRSISSISQAIIDSKDEIGRGDLNIETVKKVALPGEKQNVSDLINMTMNSLKENIQLREATILSIGEANGIVSGYVHRAYSDNSGPIAALTALKTTGAVITDSDWLKNIATKISMQIVALKPKYINRRQIPENIIKEERERLKIETTKNAKIEFSQTKLEKIVDRRIERFFEKWCLLDQKFIFDENSKETVAVALNRMAKEKDFNLQIDLVDFKLYE